MQAETKTTNLLPNVASLFNDSLNSKEKFQPIPESEPKDGLGCSHGFKTRMAYSGSDTTPQWTIFKSSSTVISRIDTATKIPGETKDTMQSVLDNLCSL